MTDYSPTRYYYIDSTGAHVDVSMVPPSSMPPHSSIYSTVPQLSESSLKGTQLKHDHAKILKMCQAGARVVGIYPDDGNSKLLGATGTVRVVRRFGNEEDCIVLSVQFDKPIGGHRGETDGNGRTGKDGYCWNCRLRNLDLLQE